VLIGVLIAMLAACSQGDPASPAMSIPDGRPTFREVQAILAARCQTCHQDGEIAPFPLVTYEDARSRAADIARVTQSREMPPWTASNEECKAPAPFKNDPRLTMDEIETLTAWSDDGAPRGNFDEVALPAAPRDLLERVDMDLVPSEAHTVSREHDEFICTIFDPEAADDRWIRGIRIVPGNRKVVHHIILSTVTPEELASWSKDGSPVPQVGVPHPCNAMIGTSLEVWTPGGTRVELPEGIAFRLPKRSLFMMGVHYSTAGSAQQTDTSHAQVQFATERPRHERIVNSIGGAGSGAEGLVSPNGDPSYRFLVPANASNHVELMRMTSGNTLHFYGVAAHMHLSGVDMKIEINRGPANTWRGDLCLLRDKWNLHWQRTYVFDAPLDSLPTFEPGDTISLKCTYNNSVSNPLLLHYLAELGKSPAEGIRDRPLGPQTEEEMCTLFPQYLVDLP
jgi:hypothetical protein